MNETFTKPQNCVLAFGIPTSKENFHNDLKRTDKEFAKMFEAGWARYNIEIIQVLEGLKKEYNKVGLNIVYDLTLSNFRKLFLNYDVVILFSHWKENEIEFSDGFVNTTEILNHIPNDFNGIVDLCVCSPKELAMGIRKTKMNCVVKYTNGKAIPSFWLHFYSVLFNYLKNNDVYYLDGLEYINGKFLTT